MGFKQREIYGGVEQWRIGDRGATNAWPGTFAKDNAAVKGAGAPMTAYGRVVAGTIVAMGPDGKLHPCGLAELLEPVSSDVDIELDPQAAKTLYVGDEVAVVSKATERNIAITGAEATELFTSATPHGLRVGDQVTISALTGGAGAEAGTYTVATVPSITTFTLTGVAYTTNITAGTLTVQLPEPAYTNITGPRNVVAVDHETGDLTLSGSAFSVTAAQIQDAETYLVKLKAYRPQGVLADHVVTSREVYGQTETDDRLTSVALQGDGRMRHCPGITPTAAYEDATALMECMKGGTYADPVTGAKVTPKFAEFTFRDV